MTRGSGPQVRGQGRCAARPALWFVLPEGAVGTVRRGGERSSQSRRSGRTSRKARSGRTADPGETGCDHINAGSSSGSRPSQGRFLRALPCPGLRLPRIVLHSDDADPDAPEPDEPRRGRFPEIVEVVVEIPRGSRNKYEFDEEATSSGSIACSRRPSTTTSTTASSWTPGQATATTRTRSC